jgi:uncharacterized protein (TIGR03435 family)
MKMLLLTIATALPLSAQTPPRLTFDTAAIHPSKPDQTFGGIKPIPGGHGYTAQNIPIKLIISLMYKVPQRQIEGGPDWMSTQRFDIEARVDGTFPAEELRGMFRNLLADRFNLKLHQDIREGNVYALTVDPAGLKLKQNTTPEDYEIPMQGPPAHTIGKRVPMNYLCWYLSQALQNDARPCADLTGLTGFYDFTLSYMPILPPGAPADALPPEYADLPSIFDAVKQQLGLRLTAQKGPVVHLVIDHIDKPTDN